MIRTPRFNRVRLAEQVRGHQPLARRLRRLTPGERLHEAIAFLDLYFREMPGGAGDARARKAEVTRALRKTGTYEHTPEELAFGAKVAWRNHARCIGRRYWRSLEVRDRRRSVDPDEIAREVADHMRVALNKGRVRSVITVFAPVERDRMPAYVDAEQISRYAGYLLRSGTVMGDRANIEATRQAQVAGWKGPGTEFDLLPLPIITREGKRVFRDLPEDVIRRVPLTHPDYPDFDALELQWHAVPCISGMIMSVGGIDYPCAPFNGFYMGTEIASRNLVDPWRYGKLNSIARAFGMDPNGSDPLWPDRTLTELNAAVIRSYHAEGVALIDHHTAAKDFMTFRADEAACGRTMHADWSWTVPPQASAVSAPFHLDLSDEAAVPNYYRNWISDGWPLMPFDGDVSRSRFGSHLHDARRWLKRRMRRPGTFR